MTRNFRSSLFLLLVVVAVGLNVAFASELYRRVTGVPGLVEWAAVSTPSKCDISPSTGCLHAGTFNESSCSCKCVAPWAGRKCDVCGLSCQGPSWYKLSRESCQCLVDGVHALAGATMAVGSDRWAVVQGWFLPQSSSSQPRKRYPDHSLLLRFTFSTVGIVRASDVSRATVKFFCTSVKGHSEKKLPVLAFHGVTNDWTPKSLADTHTLTVTASDVVVRENAFSTADVTALVREAVAKSLDTGAVNAQVSMRLTATVAAGKITVAGPHGPLKTVPTLAIAFGESAQVSQVETIVVPEEDEEVDDESGVRGTEEIVQNEDDELVDEEDELNEYQQRIMARCFSTEVAGGRCVLRRTVFEGCPASSQLTLACGSEREPKQVESSIQPGDNSVQTAVVKNCDSCELLSASDLPESPELSNKALEAQSDFIDNCLSVSIIDDVCRIAFTKTRQQACNVAKKRDFKVLVQCEADEPLVVATVFNSRTPSPHLNIRGCSQCAVTQVAGLQFV